MVMGKQKTLPLFLSIMAFLIYSLGSEITSVQKIVIIVFIIGSILLYLYSYLNF